MYGPSLGEKKKRVGGWNLKEAGEIRPNHRVNAVLKRKRKKMGKGNLGERRIVGSTGHGKRQHRKTTSIHFGFGAQENQGQGKGPG